MPQRQQDAPGPFHRAREGRGTRGPCSSGLQGLGGGEEGGPARGRGRRHYKGSARGPTPARDAHVRAAPQPPPRAPQTRASPARAPARRHALRAAKLTARPPACVPRHAALRAARPLPVPRGEPAVGGRGPRQRELRLRREALPRARGALRPPGRPEKGRGKAGGRRRPGPRGAAGPGAPAAAHGERTGAGPHQQREHGLHGVTHAHPHGACRPQALQDRDAAPGLQLHLAPGQRAAGGRGLRRRAAVPLGARLLPHGARRQPPTAPRSRRRERPAQADLHLLPEQPEEAGQGSGQKDGHPELEAEPLGHPRRAPWT